MSDKEKIVYLIGLLARVLEAIDKGTRIERGVGGMSVESQMMRTVINNVPAWPIEEVRVAMYEVAYSE
jgi:hypothetical protein